MDLATNRHYLRPSRSLNRSHNLLNNTEHQVSTDYTNVSARDSHQSQLPKKSARNSLKNVMQAGYVRPPPTIVKPFNLSRSQSRPNTHREESVQKSAKPTPRPSFTKPFVVYRSDKPLTIPQEFQLTGRNRKREPSASAKNKDEKPEDILKRLRAKASQKIVSHSRREQKPSELMQKFKEFSGKEINRIYDEFEKRRGSLKERPQNLWKI